MVDIFNVLIVRNVYPLRVNVMVTKIVWMVLMNVAAVVYVPTNFHAILSVNVWMSPEFVTASLIVLITLMKVIVHAHPMNIHVLVADALIELNYAMELIIVSKVMTNHIQAVTVSYPLCIVLFCLLSYFYVRTYYNSINDIEHNRTNSGSSFRIIERGKRKNASHLR